MHCNIQCCIAIACGGCLSENIKFNVPIPENFLKITKTAS
jgi:hypothetical protein